MESASRRQNLSPEYFRKWILRTAFVEKHKGDFHFYGGRLLYSLLFSEKGTR